MAFGNKIYAIGGWNKQPLDEMLEIDPSGEDIRVRTIGRLPAGQFGVDMIPIGTDIYMIAEIIEFSERQIGLFKVTPDTAETVRIRTKSYTWWPN